MYVLTCLYFVSVCVRFSDPLIDVCVYVNCEVIVNSAVQVTMIFICNHALICVLENFVAKLASINIVQGSESLIAAPVEPRQ